MIKTILLSTTTILFLSACASTEDISTHTSERKTYNYKDKTYQLSQETTKINDPNNKWQAPDFDLENFIKNVIHNELKKHGLKHSSTQTDIIISYGIDVNMASRKLKLFGSAEEGFFINKPKGALSIIIRSKKTNEALWLAWANSQYKQLETGTAKKRIEYAISEMFKKLPD